MNTRFFAATLAVFLALLPVSDAYAYVNVLRPDGSTEESQENDDERPDWIGWPDWIGS